MNKKLGIMKKDTDVIILYNLGTGEVTSDAIKFLPWGKVKVRQMLSGCSLYSGKLFSKEK